MILKFGTVELDLDRYELRNAGERSSIEPKAFDLLVYLVQQRPKVISKDEIYEKIWDGRIISEATLTSCVNAARKAIGDSGRKQQLIRTVPRRGYSFIADVISDRSHKVCSDVVTKATTEAPNQSHQEPSPRRASIVVLPFENLSADKDDTALADGVTEDITTSLARMRRLFVIARNTAIACKQETRDVKIIARELGVSYVLEGSIRKHSNRIRVAAQLIDALSGRHIWADSYDADLEDIFVVLDDIAQTIVRQIEPEIMAHERLQFGKRRPENLDAWELLQKGLWSFYQQNEHAHREAIALFRRATEVDPKYPPAQAHLAFSLWTIATLGRACNPVDMLNEARDVAQIALSLDPNEPLTRFTIGRLCLLDGQTELAIEHMQSAIASSPSYAGGHYGLGVCLYHGQAQAEEALAHFDYAARLNPRNPMIWATYEKQSCAHRFLGQFEEAVFSGMRARSFANDSYRPHVFLAAALSANQRIDDAKAELDQAAKAYPALSTETLEQQLCSLHPAILSDLIGWLQKAGLKQK